MSTAETTPATGKTLTTAEMHALLQPVVRDTLKNHNIARTKTTVGALSIALFRLGTSALMDAHAKKQRIYAEATDAMHRALLDPCPAGASDLAEDGPNPPTRRIVQGLLASAISAKLHSEGLTTSELNASYLGLALYDLAAGVTRDSGLSGVEAFERVSVSVTDEFRRTTATHLFDGSTSPEAVVVVVATPESSDDDNI